LKRSHAVEAKKLDVSLIYTLSGSLTLPKEGKLAGSGKLVGEKTKRDNIYIRPCRAVFVNVQVAELAKLLGL